MESIFYWTGLIVISLLFIYAVIVFFYFQLNVKVPPEISADDMPALKPIPIPTKGHKNPFYKLIVFIVEVRRWEVVENWHYQLSNDVELVIPKGFRFDAASIPRPFWAILNPTGLLLLPGLLHDYGYSYDQLWQVGPDGKIVPFKEKAGKQVWDELFKKVGKDVNGFFLINLIAWLAVALGGSGAWKKHRDKNLKAEKPVL